MGNMEKVHGLVHLPADRGHIYPPTWGHVEIIKVFPFRDFQISGLKCTVDRITNHRHKGGKKKTPDAIRRQMEK